MDDILKLTIALTFDDQVNNWVTSLAKRTTKDRGTIYRAGRESIPHVTVVQALFSGKKANGKNVKYLIGKFEEAIRAERLYAEVPDLVVSSKSIWTSTSDSGVFTGLHVLKDTMLQSLHNKCVKIAESLGGEVTSAHGIRYFPHLTIALLEPGQLPVDIYDLVKKNKVLNAPNLIVGQNGVSGSLIKVFTNTPNELAVRGKINRNTQLGRR